MTSQQQQTRLLTRLKSFLHARSMQEHWQAYQIFQQQVQWDAPPILLTGREKLRVVAYFAKRVAKLDFTERSVSEQKSRDGSKQVSVVCTFHFKPLPEFLRLPCINLDATIQLGVTDDMQTVTSIYGRLHSLPCLPDILRRLNAFFLGTVGLATEQYWSKTLWLYGDKSYVQKGSQN